MKNPIYVVKKSWSSNLTITNIVKYNCSDISSGETMYNNILKRIQGDHNRREIIEATLIENSAVRLSQLFKPTKEFIKIEKQPIIKRKELWNTVKK